VMWEMAELFEHIGTVQDGMNTLSRPQAVVDRHDAKPLQVPHGDIRFEQVRFAYNPGTPVIDQLDLHIRPGEKIGLVGRSGAGKSTVVNLLLRFYDLDSGRILIDGQDVAGVTQASLRAQVAMVTQDNSLLHRSVRDNIVYGRPDATDAQMVAAARRAEAHEFIEALVDPHGRRGYDAHVGERGVKLSGGQRQRIAIARVMLKDAPILLLDEATSALDSEVEKAIQASLYRLMEGKTVVAIAHRLSTMAASWSRAITARCWPAADSMRACGRTRAAASSARTPTTTSRCRCSWRRWPTEQLYCGAVKRSRNQPSSICFSYFRGSRAP
jgi:ATP-binding cassette subfamily B multidrug efflux pump